MFEVNDLIMCGKYGVCKVEDIGPVRFGQTGKDKVYYTLVPIYAAAGKNYVPVDSDKIAMRAVISEREAKDLIDRIQDIDALWAADDKKREAMFKQAIYSYNCEEWIGVIKAVYLRRQERNAQGKKVTMNDERYLRMAEDYLYGELAVALGIGKEEVEGFIMDRVGEMAETGME